jgi:uncharacterized repeat protein (TIGR03803 family)
MLSRRPASFAFILVVGLAAHAFSQPAAPPPFEVLRTFDSPPIRPMGGLIEGPGGLYGSSQGGQFKQGALFRLVLPTTTTGASVEKVFSFTDADYNAGRGGTAGAPLLASDGLFYGVASRGGGLNSTGWVFRVTPTGERTVLHELTFDEGTPVGDPVSGQGPLIEIGDWLYGTLAGGGPAYNGTVFRVQRSDGRFERLHAFTQSGGDGSYPGGGLVERNGWLYGTTLYGGNYGYGTLFRLTPDGASFEILHHFNQTTEGSYPRGELALGPDGLLYGGILGGGSASPTLCGSAFRFDPDATGPGSLTLLTSFDCTGTQGTNPEGGMVIVQGADGSRALYGVTTGNVNNGPSRVYRVSLDGVFSRTVLHVAATNEVCSSRLLRASDGLIYGQCLGHYGLDMGRVYRIDPATGDVSTIFRFGVDPGGSTPYALIEGRDGSLYGTMRTGGPANRGTVYRISRSGEFETLHGFTDQPWIATNLYHGSNDPSEVGATFLAQGSDGLIYGTRCDGGTSGRGSIFSIDPAQGSFQTLYSVGYGNSYGLACPHSPLVESPTAPGTFFGTATGSFDYTGSVFRFESLTGNISTLWAPGEGGLYYYAEPGS